jgi:hypothetical protein
MSNLTFCIKKKQTYVYNMYNIHDLLILWTDIVQRPLLRGFLFAPVSRLRRFYHVISSPQFLNLTEPRGGVGAQMEVLIGGLEL